MNERFAWPVPGGCLGFLLALIALLTLAIGAILLLLGYLDLHGGFNPNPQPGSGGVAPISDRLPTSGSASTTVTGDLQVTDQIEMGENSSSYVQDGLAWLSFNDGGTTEILVVFGEPANSVTVAQGPVAAIGQDDACDFDVQVTPTSISGSISCASAPVYNDGVAEGTASIQLQFSTTTVPMDDGAASDDPGNGVGGEQ